jgi:hypothetical protein
VDKMGDGEDAVWSQYRGDCLSVHREICTFSEVT